MKRILSLCLILFSLIFHAEAQSSLEFFTNQANASLQAQFGFGVTNIPVFSLTNPAVGYSAGIHYLLQSAVNNYDATTPTGDFASVFRPMFSWQRGTLYIVGYAEVTNNFFAQTGGGFKDLADPTITTNDNVWGVPWVVGAKNPVPTFNEYSYSTEFAAIRRVFFQRWPYEGGLPDTNLPPEYTNQMFIMTISNLFAVQAWNPYHAAFTDTVTIVVSNRVSLFLTNNYNWGSNMVFSTGTNSVVDSWPAWSGLITSKPSTSFIVPQYSNVTALPPSYWSETAKQFIPLDGLSNSLPMAADLMQTGWPVHVWILSITNDLMYALIDNQSGRVFDYVNLGRFGNSLDITAFLASSRSPPLPSFSPWTIGNATDQPDSPMSPGLVDQIDTDLTGDLFYGDSLAGFQPSEPGFVFGCPFNPTNAFVETCAWSAINPQIHYALEDLKASDVVQEIPPVVDLEVPLTNAVASRGVNPYYKTGFVGGINSQFQNGLFKMQFQGIADMPYAIWVSPNLVDWNEIGTAEQPLPGKFQYTTPIGTKFSAEFYDVRSP